MAAIEKVQSRLRGQGATFEQVQDTKTKQLSFEGMKLVFIEGKMRGCKVEGLSHLKIGSKVRIETEAVVTGVNFKEDTQLGGGVRTEILKSLNSKVIETL